MDSFEYFYRGICLFCGNKTEEHFHSGCYDTYEDCECEKLKEYRKARSEVEKIKTIAVLRLESIQLDEKIKEAEDTLKGLKHQKKIQRTI